MRVRQVVHVRLSMDDESKEFTTDFLRARSIVSWPRFLSRRPLIIRGATFTLDCIISMPVTSIRLYRLGKNAIKLLGCGPWRIARTTGLRINSISIFIVKNFNRTFLRILTRNIWLKNRIFFFKFHCLILNRKFFLIKRSGKIFIIFIDKLTPFEKMKNANNNSLCFIE